MGGRHGRAGNGPGDKEGVLSHSPSGSLDPLHTRHACMAECDRPAPRPPPHPAPPLPPRASSLTAMAWVPPLATLTILWSLSAVMWRGVGCGSYLIWMEAGGRRAVDE